MNNILFSIICTVFNGQEFIQECIESVLNQTYSNWELLIIDDGSTDDTFKICSRFASDRIRVFHKKNSGQYDSRLFGFSKSKGSYVLFLDSDDLFVPDTLKTIYSYVQEKDIDVVSFNFKAFSNSNIPLRKDHLIFEKLLMTNNMDIVINYFYRYFLFSLCSSCFKASVIEFANKNSKIRPSGRFGEDAVFTYEILKKVSTALLLPNVLYLYRMHAKSISHTKNLELEFQRVTNLNLIYSDLYSILPPPKEFRFNMYQKMSWPIFTYIYSSALSKNYKCFKKEFFTVREEFVTKKYFKKKGVAGFFPKMIVVLSKLRVSYLMFVLIRAREKRTKYYEKNNY